MALNFTDRKELTLDNYSFVIKENEADLLEIHLKLFIGDLFEVEDEINVYFEVYSKTKKNFRRFDIKNPLSQNEFTLVLDQDAFGNTFTASDNLYCRIKIVSRSILPKIIASKDKIKPNIFDKSGKKMKSILPLQPIDLGDKIWEIGDDDDDEPVVFFNNNINGNYIEFINDPDFRTLVMPSVLEHILKKVCTNFYEESDNVWIKFAFEKCGIQFDKDSDEYANDPDDYIEKFVQNVVQSFCVDMDIFNEYNRYKNR